MGLFRRKAEVPIRQPHITSQNDAYTFRRSRTLTGSSADSIRSAGENRAQIKSPRILTHELRSHRRRLLLYLALVVIALTGGWALLGQYTGRIDSAAVVTLPANPAISKQQYVDLVNQYFADHPLERFRFALNQKNLQGFLASKAPEVLSIDLTATKIPGTSMLTVEFRKAVVVWEIARQKYYVDANGHAFRHQYHPEPAVVVRDQSGIDPAQGAIASNRFLHFLGRVISLVDGSGAAQVTGVVIPPNTTREVDLQLAGRAFVVKTQLDRDPAGQATDAVNAIRFLDTKGIKPSYIDVRVSGKAFYR